MDEYARMAAWLKRRFATALADGIKQYNTLFRSLSLSPGVVDDALDRQRVDARDHPQKPKTPAAYVLGSIPDRVTASAQYGRTYLFVGQLYDEDYAKVDRTDGVPNFSATGLDLRERQLQEGSIGKMVFDVCKLAGLNPQIRGYIIGIDNMVFYIMIDWWQQRKEEEQAPAAKR
ncbi:MAG: hypothetical protein HY711_00100 [Candidatus Melainabacteria bacterium]|nr:hypothetical protein [Candidatus Melainabacteria bacterium]